MCEGSRKGLQGEEMEPGNFGDSGATQCARGAVTNVNAAVDEQQGEVPWMWPVGPLTSGQSGAEAGAKGRMEQAPGGRGTCGLKPLLRPYYQNSTTQQRK